MNLIEVLQRLGFLTLHSADAETQEYSITLSGREQKETFQNNLLTILAAVQSINIGDHQPDFSQFEQLPAKRLNDLERPGNGSTILLSKDVSRENLSLDTSRAS